MITIYPGSRQARILSLAILAGATSLCAPGCHRTDKADDSGTLTSSSGKTALAAGKKKDAPVEKTRGMTPAPTGPVEPAPLPPGGIRGIYLTGWSAGNKKLNKLVALVDRTEINAMVIDVKDDGDVTYNVDVPLAKNTRKVLVHAFKVDKVMAVLKAHNIFPIARIACMRDTPMAEAHPEMAVHGPDGRVWHDRTRHAWLNPYSHAVWDYNVDIALDAIKHGFKEVQFDYVRFPSEGNLKTLVYPGKPKNGLREDQISAFIKYAHDKIHAAGGWFSADVFGLTSLVTNDEGIGQKFKKVIRNVDYLCPMVYPSHYAYGEYGFKDPNKEPYKLLIKSVGDAQKRMRGTATCKLRPWLQDFSLRHVHYGPAQVRAEIKALHDLKITEYLLWNAKNNFTESALAKADPPKVVTETKPMPVHSASSPPLKAGAAGASRVLSGTASATPQSLSIVQGEL